MAATTNSTPPSDSRLYVGNLSPAVDEFVLVALFSKFGKISKLDFLFHKSGILRGKPRGYAFIEMSRRDEALKAMVELNNKLVRGKRILVTPANESQYQEHQAANQSKPGHHQSHPSHLGRQTQRGGGRPTSSDPMRPTTLSILKSQQLPKGVNNKIAALEAKLASMQDPSSAGCPPSSAPLPSGSTAGLRPNKPSFLPENPTIYRTPGVDQKSRKRGVSKPSTKQPSSAKNPSSLEAVGLTLKEQLKRHRQARALDSSAPPARKSCLPVQSQPVQHIPPPSPVDPGDRHGNLPAEVPSLPQPSHPQIEDLEQQETERAKINVPQP